MAVGEWGIRSEVEERLVWSEVEERLVWVGEAKTAAAGAAVGGRPRESGRR